MTMPLQRVRQRTKRDPRAVQERGGLSGKPIERPSPGSKAANVLPTITNTTMKLYEPHPLALIFPEMNDAAIDAMAADIKAHGLQNPIVLYQDKVLDGLQRQEACKRVGVPPLYLQFILLPRSIVEAGPEAFVISANLHRRHLKPEKYKALVRKLVPLVEKQLKEQATNEGAVTNDTAPTNPKGGGVSGKPGIKKKAVQKVAKMTGHSERTVYRVLKNGAKHISATLPKRKKEKRTRMIRARSRGNRSVKSLLANNTLSVGTLVSGLLNADWRPRM